MIQMVSSVVRHIISTYAGSLIAEGVISDGDVQLISGAVLTIGAIVWSIIEKKYFTKK